MSVFDRMAAINAKMQQFQTHSAPNSVNVRPAALNQGQPLNQSSAQTFEQLLATAKDSEVSKQGAVASPSNVPYGKGEKDFEGLIKSASTKYNVDEDLIRSVMRQESGFNPNAVSVCGASGLMQLMPETAKDLGVKNIMDPEDNLMGGVKYLRQMLDRYDGNKTKALAAYNAGPGNVDKYGGVPPFAETQNYVKNILAMYDGYKNK